MNEAPGFQRRGPDEGQNQRVTQGCADNGRSNVSADQPGYRQGNSDMDAEKRNECSKDSASKASRDRVRRRSQPQDTLAEIA